MITSVEPLVSIVLCTYNGEIFIRKLIDSLLDQTYKNIEIIALDDCSADSTFFILSDYTVRHPSIKVYQNESNIGFNRNFEKAIQLSAGDYIAICDQDDIWLPAKIETLVKHIKDNWLIFSNSDLINENDQLIEKSLLSDAFSIKKSSYRSILINNFVTGHTCLFSRSFIDQIYPMPERGYYDWWMGFVALYHHKIAFINLKLTLYRQHDESVINKEIKPSANNQSERNKVDFRSTSTMLTVLAGCSRIAKADRAFITTIFSMYHTIDEKQELKWKIFIYLNFNQLFAFEKNRGFFSTTRIKKSSAFVENLLQVKKSIS
ncbi:glycosyltransferase [Pedobacter frigidisoli]|uniref:glycosyltransferase n=1 Tax=Pedobacter frigidisoli TaxID=2530455 RepID=UPI00292DE5D5|nr:glycosyltransferase [Pedobacter frigidisoli]